MSKAKTILGAWLAGTAILTCAAVVVLVNQFRSPASAVMTERSIDRAALSEKEKIAALLDDLSGSGAKFVRNGAEYSGAEAADHLRRKWRAAGERVTTAREFIDALASRSSSSGEAYRVLDGETSIESGPWFLARLEKIEGSDVGGRASTPSRQTVADSDNGAGKVLALIRASPERFRIVESDEIEFYTGRELARRIGLKHVLAGGPELPIDAFIDRFCTTSSLHGTKYEVDGTPPSGLSEWLRAKVVR